jgi:hypothetical protein
MTTFLVVFPVIEKITHAMSFVSMVIANGLCEKTVGADVFLVPNTTMMTDRI